MEDGMLDSSDILIHRHPVVDPLFIERAFVIVRAGETVKVPGGLDKGIHGVGLPPAGPTALRTFCFHKLLCPCKGRLTHPGHLHIIREGPREDLFRVQEQSRNDHSK